MTVSKYVTTLLGAVINAVETLPAVTGTGVVVPQFTPGMVADGDSNGRFVYVKLVLASALSLVDGTFFVLDKDFNASLLSTANSPFGARVGVARATAELPIGTHYLWLQTSGGAPAAVVATTPLANTKMETTATAGRTGAPAAATVGSKLITGIVLTAANAGAAASVEAILSGPTVGLTN